MDENAFWVAVWRTVAGAVVALAAVIASCSAHSTKAVTVMVQNGANPIDAACAAGKEGLKEACAIRAAKATQ